MSPREIFFLFGGIVISKAIEDNLPSFKYKNILTFSKKAVGHLKAFGVIIYVIVAWQLDKHGIIKVSPQLKNSVVIAIGVALLAQFLSKIQANKITIQPTASSNVPSSLTLNR